jgi:serine/threonine-protein kinase
LVTPAATERVGRYQLLEPIGVGPSGAVSRAKVFGVAGFERQFAIKRFHPELTSSTVVAQALSSAARAYGSLEHPRIARMSEFGVVQGTTFTAVEFVSGLDALRLIAEARMAGATIAPGGALALVSQAARAVGYAHGRGLTHLGLAPTNVMVTAEGDIKITDFGILAAALPQRPAEVPRFGNRIAYLAPEQIANEATSAATDVFALGVLAYELVTGHRTFRGETAQQIAQSVLAGPPIEPPLPRPIVRVLQRCLARSPFERFPDARAFADALDAALRVAPVPGTRKDVGAQVKQSMDRIAALHEGEMSGVLALNIGTGPLRRGAEPSPADRGPPPVAVGHANDFSTDEMAKLEREPGLGPAGRLAAAAAGGAATIPTQPMMAAATVQDVPPRVGPVSTVTGLPPMPVPVPPGLSSPSIASPSISSPSISAPPSAAAPPPAMGTSTLLGIPPHKVAAAIGARPTPPGGAAAPPPPPRSEAATPPTGAATRPAGLPRLPTPLPFSEEAGASEPARPGGPPPRPEGPARAGAGGPPPRPAAPPPPPGPGGRPVRLASEPGRPGGPPPPPGLRSTSPAGDERPSRRITIDASNVPEVSLSEIVLDNPATEEEEDDAEVDLATGTHNRARLAAAAMNAGLGEVEPRTSPSADASDAVDTVPDETETLLRSSGATSADETESETVLRPGRVPADDRDVPGDASGDAPDDAPEDAPDDAPEISDLPAPVSPRTARLGLLPEEPVAFAGGTNVEAPPIRGFDEALPRLPPPAMPGLPPEGAAPGAERASLRLPEAPPYGGGHLLPAPQGAGFPDESLPPEFLPLGAGPAGYPPAGLHGEPELAGASPGSRSRRRLLFVVGGLAVVAVLAVAGWFVYGALLAGGPTTGPVAGGGSSGSGAATTAGGPTGSGSTGSGSGSSTTTAGGTGSGSAGSGSAGSGSAAIAVAPADAGVPDAATRPTGELAIVSTPPGARVFLDGADVGVTPLKLPGSPDRHTVALLLAGRELYVAQVDGQGQFSIPLKEVVPGPALAGIKVLRCKDKDRYYVFVDGKPTGQTCPTERINTTLGPHTVEVYDVVTETRRKWEINIKDGRLSYRIRIDP